MKSNDHRYTLPSTLDLCLKIVGVQFYSLDAAATTGTQVAPQWWTPEQDGLTQPWSGHTFVNPPWSDIPAWIRKAKREMARLEAPFTISMLLPANRTDQGWWQELVEPCIHGLPHDCAMRDAELSAHFLPGRIRYGSPGDTLGKLAGSPRFGSVLLIFKRSP